MSFCVNFEGFQPRKEVEVELSEMESKFLKVLPPQTSSTVTVKRLGEEFAFVFRLQGADQEELYFKELNIPVNLLKDSSRFWMSGVLLQILEDLMLSQKLHS